MDLHRRLLMCVAGGLLAVSVLFAQEVPAGVLSAFTKGNATELTPFLGDEVEVIVYDKAHRLSKEAVTPTLSSFFAKNKVTGFQVNHKGRRQESGFMVGTLTTHGGNYRVNCFLRKVKNKYVIHQIRIDKTNE